MLILKKLLIFLLVLIVINKVESLRCGKGAVNPIAQKFNLKFSTNGYKKREASYQGTACRFIDNDGNEQLYTEKAITVYDSPSLGKWINGEIKYVNVKRDDANARYYIAKNLRRIWISKRKPEPSFTCPEGSTTKEGFEIDFTALTYRYGTAAVYNGLVCQSTDKNTTYKLKEPMTVYDMDSKGRWSGGQLNINKPNKKQLENIQLYISSDKKVLKIRS